MYAYIQAHLTFLMWLTCVSITCCTMVEYTAREWQETEREWERTDITTATLTQGFTCNHTCMVTQIDNGNYRYNYDVIRAPPTPNFSSTTVSSAKQTSRKRRAKVRPGSGYVQAVYGVKLDVSKFSLVPRPSPPPVFDCLQYAYICEQTCIHIAIVIRIVITSSTLQAIKPERRRPRNEAKQIVLHCIVIESHCIRSLF